MVCDEVILVTEPGTLKSCKYLSSGKLLEGLQRPFLQLESHVAPSCLLSLPGIFGSGELRGPGAGQRGREAGCLSNLRGGEIKRLPKFSLSIFSPGCSGREDTWPLAGPAVMRQSYTYLTPTHSPMSAPQQGADRG